MQSRPHAKPPLNAPDIFSDKIWRSARHIDSKQILESVHSSRRDINQERIDNIRVKACEPEYSRKLTRLNSKDSTEKSTATDRNRSHSIAIKFQNQQEFQQAAKDAALPAMLGVVQQVPPHKRGFSTNVFGEQSLFATMQISKP